MQINLWKNEHGNYWKWTLIDNNFNMEIGETKFFHDAMMNIESKVNDLINKSDE